MTTETKENAAEKGTVRLKRYLSIDFWTAIGNGFLGSLVATVAILTSVPIAICVSAIYLILIIFLVDRKRRKTLEALISRRARYDLTRTSLQKIARILKTRLGASYAQREYVEKMTASMGTPNTKSMNEILCGEDFDENRTRKKTIYTILDMICEQFSRDTFGKIIPESDPSVEEDIWPHDFFKATYYERLLGSDRKEYLVRVQHVYPIGMTPRDESKRRLLTPEQSGTAYFVIQNGEMRIIENVRDEKQRKEKGWINYYEGQHERYSSILLMPVVHDLGVTGSRTIGVVTIDTGRPRYFRDTPEFKAFLSDLLSPYLNFLALAWETERLHESLCILSKR